MRPCPSRGRWLVVTLPYLLAASAAVAWPQDLESPFPDGREASFPRSEEDPASSVLDQIDRADTNDVVDVLADRSLVLVRSGEALKIGYMGNRCLDEIHVEITRAVVIIHGTLRNVDDYYRSIADGAITAGVEGTTLIFAAQFLTEADIVRHSLSDSTLYWAYMGWRQGDASLSSTEHPRPWRISAFAVIDTVLARLAAHNPNLRQIVVAGHSAGGQFLNRYAAGTRMHQTLKEQYGDSLRYIVSNPSCYMYFDPERWVEGSSYQFEVPPPEFLAICPDYDDYKYGLEDPNDYMNIGAETLRRQYAQRELIYLLGGADTDPNSYYLEKSCPAMTQGLHRLQRGIVHVHHLIDSFGPAIMEWHKLAIVPRIGHDQYRMFNSTCGLRYLFDFGNCPPQGPDMPWQDVTTTLLASVSGHSIAWGDYDNDGNQDLFVAATDALDRLIRNRADGTFTDATAPPLNNPSNGMGAAWGDYDRDGLLDLYEVNWQASGKLLHNDGGGHFTDVTTVPLAVSGSGVEPTWVDYDNEGDLDLYITRTDGQSNVLLRNDGGGEFTDVSAEPIGLAGDSQGAAWGDYDNDGDQDLYVCAGSGWNHLFRNDGNGVFTDVTGGPLAGPGNSSSAAWGDFDNDGDLDLYLVNQNAPNRLLRNDGGGSFTDVASSPVNVTAIGRSSTWGDYDNDGLLDLYVSNANTANRLFRNQASGVFTDATAVPLDDIGQTCCAAWADYDGDGDLDLYMANNAGANKLFRNLLSSGNHWLHVNLVGTVSNAFGVGSRIRIRTAQGIQIRQVGGDSGYQAQNSITAEFGLGLVTAVDTLVVNWPSGLVQRVLNPGIDQVLSITETPETVVIEPQDVGAGCLSTVHPCAQGIPFGIWRTGETPVRKYVVVFSLGPELALCNGLDSIVEGPYLRDAGSTTFQAQDNPDGTCTVTCEIISGSCTTAPSGTLFLVDVTYAVSSGTGRIMTASGTLTSCGEFSWPSSPGAPLEIPIDAEPPAAIADLHATQLRSGNGNGGTTGIELHFTPPGDAASLEVWRAPFGGYPEYDGAGGATPQAPGWSETPPPPWVRTGVTATEVIDAPPARDFWYYAAFSKDACGNVSPASNMTSGTLNYHLGDVSDGTHPGSGDNAVNASDICLFSAYYGTWPAPGDPMNCIDVGPTTDFSVHARPTTDGLIEFEDMMMFALNYGRVGFKMHPAPMTLRETASADTARVAPPRLVLQIDPAQGIPRCVITARVILVGNADDVKGLHALVAFDARFLQMLELTDGRLLQEQPGEILFLSRHVTGGVIIDAAALGEGEALDGSGEVAVLRFRMLGAGEKPELIDVVLRDRSNQPFVRLQSVSTTAGLPAISREAPGAPAGAVRSSKTGFLGAGPNPFTSSTTIRFSLASPEHATLRIYDPMGRMVRTLVDEALSAGDHGVSWDGLMSDGRRANAGVHLYRVQAGRFRAEGRILYLK